MLKPDAKRALNDPLFLTQVNSSSGTFQLVHCITGLRGLRIFIKKFKLRDGH